MKFCIPHWDLLKDKIKEIGLYDLVPTSGKEAVEKTIKSMENPSLENFDPLMTAHNMILGNAMEIAGLEVLVDNEGGTERCPLCFLKADNWIEFAARDTKIMYEESFKKDVQ